MRANKEGEQRYYPPQRRYTVWDNRSDEMVILDGSARDAARAMGVKISSFYTTVCRSRNGKNARWTVDVREAADG